MTSATATARPRRRPPTLAALALVLVALLSVALHRAGAFAAPPEFHATAYDPPEPAADFLLTEHTGRQVRLGDFRGKAVLLFFGYANCPDVCPLTLARLRRVLDDVDPARDRAHVLLVTVDPERDSPEALARYLSSFGPGVSGLTGSAGVLATVYAAYGVDARPAPAHTGHPMVSHSSAVFGIDREGQIRVLLRTDNPEAELTEDVRTLLGL